MTYPEISEDERFPIISPAGRRLLHRMRQHPHAPIWNWPNGEQLDQAGLASVQEFAAALHGQRPSPTNGAPAWVSELVDFCLEDVPFYRRRSPPGTPFQSIPSCSREDLAPRVWEFVPDRESLDQLIVFSSSGTTGHPSRLPSHPATAACGVPLIEYALARYGIAFPRGADSVGLTNIAAYQDAFTTAIVVSYLQESGCVRVNLHPSAWRSPEDCAKYLNGVAVSHLAGRPHRFCGLGKDRPGRATASHRVQHHATIDWLGRRVDIDVMDAPFWTCTH